MAKNYRGSQKHVLDLLDSGQSGISALNGLLASFDAQITESDVMRPSGTMATKEFYLPQFCAEFCKDRFDFSSIIDWWVPSPWRPPTWDLISTFTANNDKHGILLVEAKAHENEFNWSGKKLKPQPSIGSKKNHAQIVHCLTEANDALSASIDGSFRLSVDSHYQLANRVAHLWKLATCGIPVILLYVGFIGDQEIDSSYFHDDEHWQRAMGGYLQGVVPQSFLSTIHPVDPNGSLLMLSRSLSVLSPSSPSRSTRH